MQLILPEGEECKKVFCIGNSTFFISKNGTPSSIFETSTEGLQEKCKEKLKALKELRGMLKEKVADPKEIEKAMNPVDFVHYQCMFLLHMMNRGPLEESSTVDMMKVWLKMNEHSIYSPLPYFKNPIQEWVLRELYPSMTEGKCLGILSQEGLEWKRKEGFSGDARWKMLGLRHRAGWDFGGAAVCLGQVGV